MNKLGFIVGTFVIVMGCATVQEVKTELKDAAVDVAQTKASKEYVKVKNKVVKETKKIDEKIGTRYSNLFEYEVEKGDTLWHIAGKLPSMKFESHHWPALLIDNENLDEDPDALIPHQVILVRKKYKHSALDDAKETSFGWRTF